MRFRLVDRPISVRVDSAIFCNENRQAFVDGLSGYVAKRLVMGSGVIMKGVGYVSLVRDRISGRLIDILRPIWSANNDDVIGIVGANRLDNSNVIGLKNKGLLNA